MPCQSCLPPSFLSRSLPRLALSTSSPIPLAGSRPLWIDWPTSMFEYNRVRQHCSLTTVKWNYGRIWHSNKSSLFEPALCSESTLRKCPSTPSTPSISSHYFRLKPNFDYRICSISRERRKLLLSITIIISWPLCHPINPQCAFIYFHFFQRKSAFKYGSWPCLTAEGSSKLHADV